VSTPLTDNGDALLQALSNYVCGNLPEGWSLCLQMERNAGWIFLLDPSGTETIPGDIDPAESTMAEQIVACVKAAKQWNEQP
jgi:hypothetical protein